MVLLSLNFALTFLLGLSTPTLSHRFSAQDIAWFHNHSYGENFTLTHGDRKDEGVLARTIGDAAERPVKLKRRSSSTPAVATLPAIGSGPNRNNPGALASSYRPKTTAARQGGGNQPSSSSSTPSSSSTQASSRGVSSTLIRDPFGRQDSEPRTRPPATPPKPKQVQEVRRPPPRSQSSPGLQPKGEERKGKEDQSRSHHTSQPSSGNRGSDGGRRAGGAPPRDQSQPKAGEAKVPKRTRSSSAARAVGAAHDARSQQLGQEGGNAVEQGDAVVPAVTDKKWVHIKVSMGALLDVTRKSLASLAYITYATLALEIVESLPPSTHSDPHEGMSSAGVYSDLKKGQPSCKIVETPRTNRTSTKIDMFFNIVVSSGSRRGILAAANKIAREASDYKLKFKSGVKLSSWLMGDGSVNSVEASEQTLISTVEPGDASCSKVHLQPEPLERALDTWEKHLKHLRYLKYSEHLRHEAHVMAARKAAHESTRKRNQRRLKGQESGSDSEYEEYEDHSGKAERSGEQELVDKVMAEPGWGHELWYKDNHHKLEFSPNILHQKLGYFAEAC